MSCRKKITMSLQLSIPGTSTTISTATLIPLGGWLPATGMDAWRGVVRVKSALGGGTIKVGIGVQTATVRTDNPGAFDTGTITWGTADVAENPLAATITSATASVMWCRPVLAA